MDFSGYKIWIEQNSGAATLVEPDRKLRFAEENELYDFNSGIKKLQEEKRAMYLTDDLSNKEMSDYFKKEFGIFVV